MNYQIMEDPGWQKDLPEWYDNFSDALCTTFSMISLVLVFIYPIYIAYMMAFTREDSKHNSEIETVLDGFKTSENHRNGLIIYCWVEFAKKLTIVSSLILLDGQTNDQIQVFFMALLISSCVLLQVRPFADVVNLKLQLFNDFSLYCICLLDIIFLLASDNKQLIQKLRDKLGIMIIALVLLNFGMNIFVVIVRSLISIRKSCKQKSVQKEK